MYRVPVDRRSDSSFFPRERHLGVESVSGTGGGGVEPSDSNLSHRRRDRNRLAHESGRGRRRSCPRLTGHTDGLERLKKEERDSILLSPTTPYTDDWRGGGRREEDPEHKGVGGFDLSVVFLHPLLSLGGYTVL